MGTATSKETFSDTEARGNKPFSDLWAQRGTVKAVILFPRFDVGIFTSMSRHLAEIFSVSRATVYRTFSEARGLATVFFSIAKPLTCHFELSPIRPHLRR